MNAMTAQLPKTAKPKTSPSLAAEASSGKDARSSLRGMTVADGEAKLAPEQSPPSSDRGLGDVLRPSGASKTASPASEGASSQSAAPKADRKAENEARKAAQLAKKDEVHAAREAARKPQSAKEKANAEKAAEFEATKETRQAAWEEKVKKQHAFSAEHERLEQTFEAKEAFKYKDAKLQAARGQLDTAKGAMDWDEARKHVKSVKTEVDALKPHIDFFKVLEKDRLPWVRAKLGKDADTKLKKTEERVAGRYELGRDELAKLKNWLDTNYMGSVERPQTEQEFNEVKHDDGLAQDKLDELLAKGVVRSGGLARKYKSSYDTGADFSVEYTIQGLPQIVVHAHCTSGGHAKPGNACHWKFKSQKTSAGASHSISDKFVAAIMDVSANKSAPIQR
jgi:hypothetical protein